MILEQTQLPATEVENIVQDVVSSNDNDVDKTLLVIPVTDDDADNSHTLYIVSNKWILLYEMLSLLKIMYFVMVSPAN